MPPVITPRGTDHQRLGTSFVTAYAPSPPRIAPKGAAAQVLGCAIGCVTGAA